MQNVELFYTDSLENSRWCIYKLKSVCKIGANKNGHKWFPQSFYQEAMEKKIIKQRQSKQGNQAPIFWIVYKLVFTNLWIEVLF